MTTPTPTSPRVLFVIPGEASGSSMVFARRQADALGALGIQVSCFFLKSRTSPSVLLKEAVRFRAECREFRPDVVHAHFGTVTAAFAALASGRTPLAITYRGSDLNRVPTASGLRAFAGRALSQFAALAAEGVICVSQDLRSRLWWRKRDALVLPSGVDIDEFAPMDRDEARGQLGWQPWERVVLFNAGYDARNKRLDLAEAAVSQLQITLPEARLEVLDGSAHPDRMPVRFNAADCLLVTSDAEGSPTVVQEALACNLPIVSVVVGDVPQRLRGVTGTRLVARDPKLLAGALQELLTSGERSQGRLRCHEFSSRTIAGRLASVYREIAAKTQSRNRIWNTTLFSLRPRS